MAAFGKLVAGDDWWAARRHLVDDRAVQLAVEGEGEGARYGRGGHDEQVGARALITKGCSLHDAEAVLLVDDCEGELRDIDALLDDGVRADDYVDLLRREHEAHVVLDALGEASQQEADRDRAFTYGDGHDVLALFGGGGVPEEPGDGQEVLLGEDLRRREEGCLVAVQGCCQHRKGGDDGLAASHVAFEEPAHGGREPEVGEYLVGGPVLRFGQGERERVDERVQLGEVGVERDAGILLLPEELAAEDGHLEQEHLVEGQPAARRLLGLGGVGVVHL